MYRAPTVGRGIWADGKQGTVSEIDSPPRRGLYGGLSVLCHNLRSGTAGDFCEYRERASYFDGAWRNSTMMSCPDSESFRSCGDERVCGDAESRARDHRAECRGTIYRAPTAEGKNAGEVSEARQWIDSDDCPNIYGGGRPTGGEAVGYDGFGDLAAELFRAVPTGWERIRGCEPVRNGKSETMGMGWRESQMQR